MNSIIIFGLHGHVLFFIIPKIKTFFNLSTLYTLIPLARLNWLDSIIIVLNKSIISLLLTSAQIVFLCLLIPIFNNRLYFLLGRKKPKMANPSEVPNVVTPTPPGMGSKFSGGPDTIPEEARNQTIELGFRFPD